MTRPSENDPEKIYTLQEALLELDPDQILKRVYDPEEAVRLRADYEQIPETKPLKKLIAWAVVTIILAIVAKIVNWASKSIARLSVPHILKDLSTLHNIRYTAPTNDREASRWPNHPIWNIAQSEAETALAPYSSAATRGKIVEGLKAAAIDHFQRLIPGVIGSYGQLRGYQIGDLPAVLDLVSQDVRRYAHRNPKAMAEKFRRAEERHAFLQ